MVECAIGFWQERKCAQRERGGILAEAGRKRSRGPESGRRVSFVLRRAHWTGVYGVSFFGAFGALYPHSGELRDGLSHTTFISRIERSKSFSSCGDTLRANILRSFR